MAKKKAVCLDIDDTVLDFAGTLCRLYNNKNETCLSATDLASWDFKDINLVDARGNKASGKDLREMFLEYEKHGLYATLPLFADAREALHILEIIDYDVIFITARNEKYRIETEIALVMSNVKYAKLIFAEDKAAAINRLKKEYSIRAFADDKAETVDAVADRCDLEYTFLLDKPYNQAYVIKEDSGITRIKSVLEILRHLR